VGARDHGRLDLRRDRPHIDRHPCLGQGAPPFQRASLVCSLSKVCDVHLHPPGGWARRLLDLKPHFMLGGSIGERKQDVS